jgi:hypothetical protein
MGLDMYLRIENSEDPEEPDEEIACWRKHADLNGWFENLWISKYKPSAVTHNVELFGKTFEMSTFNVEKVYLSLEDLENLNDDLQAGLLPSTDGFFHAGNKRNEDFLSYDLEAVAKAAVEVALGKKVYYICWW